MGIPLKEKVKKNCKACGSEFVTSRKGHIFCRTDCQQKWHNQLSGGNNTYLYDVKLSPGSMGAIAELKVCCDLMTKGYEVFRAVSPSCSSDLIASKDNNILKIEVRTGRYSANRTKFYYPNKNIKSDIVAVFTHSDSKIRYIPEL